MIVEMRTYALHIGKLNAFLEIYERLGLPIQKRVLGNLIGFFQSEIGPLNQVVHLWGYESFADREVRRAALAKVPEWQPYLVRLAPIVASMESRILTPVRFSPLQ